jgi:hypothetical protein
VAADGVEAETVCLRFFFGTSCVGAAWPEVSRAGVLRTRRPTSEDKTCKNARWQSDREDKTHTALRGDWRSYDCFDGCNMGLNAASKKNDEILKKTPTPKQRKSLARGITTYLW